MTDDPASGRLFGVPYSFEVPTPRELLSDHWRPGEGAFVEKPFGVGWTINLASPRTWLLVGLAFVLGVVLARIPTEDEEFPADDPVEIEI